MSNAARKRHTKWDYKEESQHSVRESDWRMRESELDRFSPESHGRNGDRRLAKDADDKLKSKHEMGGHSRESWARSRGLQNDDCTNEDFVKNLRPVSEWEGAGSYRSKRSSGRNEYRQLSCHRSPRNDWLRPRSSRSRSRSRSRSGTRSRSPIYGYKKQIGFDRSKSRSGPSAQQDEDYIGGRYRRENDRQFARQGDQSEEDAWDSRERKARDSKYSTRHDPRDQAMRGGRSRHDLANRERENDRRNGDIMLEHSHNKSELHRSSDIPCKFFAAGNCRNGRYCRFSHHCDVQRSPDKKFHDDKRGWTRNSDYLEKSWNEPKFTDAGNLDAAKANEFSNGNVVNSGRGFATRSHNDRLNNQFNTNAMSGEAAACKAVQINEKEASQWKAEVGSFNAGISESKGNGNWLEDMEMSPDWNYGIQTSNSNVKEAQTAQPRGLNNTSIPSYEHGRGKETSWRPETTTTLPAMIDNRYLQQDLKYSANNAHSSDDRCATGNLPTSQLDLNASSNILPVQAFDPSGQVSGVSTYLSSQAVGDSRASILFDHSRGSSIKNFENGTLAHVRKSVDKSVTRDMETSQVGAACVPEHLVTREQLSQITNISASLAQLLGTGQQLPQLYSAQTPQNAVRVPSKLTIQPNQVVVDQKQYDPINDSIETKQLDSHSGVTGNSSEQKSIGEPKPEILPNSLTTLTVANVDGNAHHEGPATEKEPTDRSQVPSQPGGVELVEISKMSKENVKVKSEKSSKVKGDSKAAQESGWLENIDADSKSGEPKKGKDLKAFKFALVETVKELLKPAWKEGRVSKDSYKSIVKKVVDKVTGTMQGANVPQTQEKIDHYLSVSRPKLTKLVQAYVGKFQKSTN